MSTVHRHRRTASLVLLALFANGCGKTLPYACPVLEGDVRIPVRGLWTSPNDFESPEGSTEVFTNMTSDTPDVWEPRRGFSLLQATGPTITGPIGSMEFFRGSLIVHHNTNQISRWTGSAWSTYSGTYAAPSSSRSGRVHFAKAAQSLFVTTSTGVYELDTPTGTWRLTGCPPALDGSATLRRTVNETGFATANGQWAYRDEWGIKNANGRLQIGPPSGRTLVQSPASVVATTGNIAKLNASSTVTVTNTTHGYVTGEYVDVTLGGAETYFAAGTFQVTRVSATSFTYSDAVNNGSGVTQNPAASITYGFTAGRGVTRVIAIPSGITTDNFVQVYRSSKSASATAEPSDQLGQVYERSPTNLEITAGSMTITDIVPDDFRGALMDVSGETVLAAKYRPPASSDMAAYHDVTFYAATRTIQALEFQFVSLAVTPIVINFFDSPTAIDSGSFGSTLSSDSAESVGTRKFKVYTDGSVSQNIANTARSFVRVVNGQVSSVWPLYAAYISGDQEAPGKVVVYARTLTVTQFAAAYTDGNGAASADIVPTFPYEISPSTLARSGSTVTAVFANAHGLASGQIVRLDGSSNTSHFPNGNKTITVVDPLTITYTESGSTVAAEANDGLFFSSPPEEMGSGNIDRTDRIVYSLPDRPSAVPLPNEIFCDGIPVNTTTACPTIERVLATRDRLYIPSDSALVQVTGFYPDFLPYTIQMPFKSRAPESWVSTGTPGRVYGLTDVGFVEVLNNAEVISTPIQDQIQAVDVTLAAAGHSNYVPLYGFGIAYPQDYKVLLFLPTSGSNTWADTAWVWHTRTGDWAKWDFSAQKPTAGVLDPDAERLYIGTTTGAVLVERKARTLADYYDVRPASIAYAASGAFGGTTITGTTTAGMTVGEKVTDLSSGTETTIVSIDSGTQITVASVTGFSGGGGNLYVSGGVIPSTVQWTRWYGKDGPNVDKEVDSGLILFQPPSLSAPGTAEFSSLSLAVSNDYNPTFSAPETLTLSSVVTSQMPFLVPTDMQRGGLYRFKMAHSKPGERYKLLGLSLNAVKASVKAGP